MGQAVIYIIEFLCDYFRAEQPGTNKWPPYNNTTICSRSRTEIKSKSKAGQALNLGVSLLETVYAMCMPV